MKGFTKIAALVLLLFSGGSWKAFGQEGQEDNDLRKKIMAEGEAALAAGNGATIPQSMPMVDVTYSNGSTGHAFFLQLPRSKMLVAATPAFLRIKSMTFQGQDFQPG